MKKKILFCSMLVIPLSLFSADFKKVDSPFLGSVKEMKKADWHENLYWYRHPKKRAIEYKNFIFDPVLVYQSENSAYPQLTDEDIQTVGSLFKKKVEGIFQNEVKIVSEPGPSTLRVRFAIRGLKRGQYYMDQYGDHKIKPDSKLAAATFEMDAIDSLNGERIVALMQNIDPKELEKSEKEEIGLTIESIFEDWVKMLKTVFSSQKAEKSVPK